MKYLRNQSGYALLISFAFILLLIIFMTSFSIRAANNYKQVEQTDDTYELTSIAEMGIEYYLAAITHKIASYQDSTTSEGKYLQGKVNTINNYIESQNKNKLTPSKSVIDGHINESMNKLISDVDDLLEIKCNHETSTDSQLKTNPNCLQEPNGANFEIIKSVKNNERTWTVSVVGKLPNINKTKVIEATYNIPPEFSLIKLGQNGASTGSEFQPGTPVVNITFDSLFEKQIPTSNFVVNLKDKTFQNNNYNGNLEKDDSNKNAEINALGNVNLTKDGKNVQILARGTVTFDSSATYDSMNLYSKAALFKQNINGNLLNSLIEVEDSISFIQKLPMSGSKIQVNNNEKSTKIIASFDDVELSNESLIKVNGATTFNKISTVNNSKILINGPLTIKDYINNITNGSELTVIGKTNFGNYISSIQNSTVTVYGNAEIGYFQGIKVSENKPAMDIKGVLTITSGATKTTISDGTVVVDSIAYGGNAKLDPQIEITNTGKLCIRDKSKVDILFGNSQKAKSTGNGSIIVLDKSKDPDYEEMLQLNNKTTGSHDILVGLNVFNTLCSDGGTSTPISSDQYIVNEKQLTETDVKKDIYYK